MKRILLSALPVLILMLILAGTAWAAPQTPDDVTAQSCTAGTSVLELILRAVLPWTPTVLVAAILGHVFGFDARLAGAFQNAISVVGSTGMSVILALSSSAIAGVIVAASKIPACP